MRKLLLLLLFILTIFNIYSIDDYIGNTPEMVISKLGSPILCYTERGDNLKDDDVVFFYKNRIYLYFNNSRVWQVRVDNKYKDMVGDLKIGDNKQYVLELLGEPIKIIEESILYKRPDRGYNTFLRLYFINDRLDDIYIYRGDY